MKMKSQHPIPTSKAGGWVVTYRQSQTPVEGGSGRSILHVGSPDGQNFEVTLPPSALLHPARTVDLIVDQCGCTLDPDGLNAAVQAAAATKPKRTVRITTKSGRYGNLFVTPGKTIRLKPKAKRKVIFDPSRAAANEAAASLGKTSGTLRSWQHRVAPLVAKSSIGITLVGAAFAAPLLELAGLPESFILAVVGNSGSGKSVACLSAMSVQGAAVRAGLIPPTIPPRALEETGTAYNGLLCPFDDLSRLADDKVIRAVTRWLTYHFADGGGRLVSDKAVKQGLPFERFKSIGLISYEKASKAAAQLVGEDRLRGETARMFDLHCDEEVGVFDRLGDGDAAAEIAIALERLAAEHYGTPLPRFLVAVFAMKEKKLRACLNTNIDAFVRSVAAGADPVQVRAARKFGLIYAALKLARQAGVVPWGPGLIGKAVRKTYRGAMRDETPAATGADLVQRLRRFLASPDAILTVSENGVSERDLSGPWFALIGLKHQKLPKLGLKEEALRLCCPNAVARQRLVAELESCGWLEPGRGKKAWQAAIREKGKKVQRPRLLRCSMALLG
jgi:hypothetical protein